MPPIIQPSHNPFIPSMYKQPSASTGARIVEARNRRGRPPQLHVNDCGLISVNNVDVAGDLEAAVVFISIFGSADQQKHGQALNEHRIRSQGLVGKSVVLKYTRR